MQIAQIPLRFPLPFAAAAGGGYITYPIPTPTQIPITPGASSLTTGFPPLNFDPVGSGGIPFNGSELNGILYWTTVWEQWHNAGGPTTYDSTFSTAIGGYPKGALLNVAGAAYPGYWFSLVDDNTSNPDSGGANWQQVTFGTTYAGNPNGSVAGVAVSANSITNSLLWDLTNKVLWICTTTGNAASAVWSTVTGTVTAVSVATANGFAGTSSGGGAPVLTIGTPIDGLLKGDGTGMVLATPGSDYTSPLEFAFLPASPGFQKLPTGFCIQWGITAPVPSGAGGLAVTFPIAFPTACVNVTPTFTNAANPGTGKDMNPNLIATSVNGFTITQQSGTPSQYSWVAIGF